MLIFVIDVYKAQLGNYFITNYSSNSYNGAIQNLDITQDDFGLIYFANNSSIMEYNGKTWQPILVTDGAKTPYSLAKSKNGTIYVGSENEIGFLEKSAKGKLAYKSVLNLLKNDEKDFNEVWNTFVINDDVYYCANERIIRYSNGKIKTWKPKTSFHKAQVVNGTLLVREINEGLMFLNGDKFEKIENSDILAPAEYKIAFYIQHKNKDEYLIFTRKKGVFTLKLNMADLKKSIITRADDNLFKIFGEFEPYDGVILENRNVVVGSLGKGLFVFDENYQLLQTINTNNGIMDDECKRLFVDKQKNLWVAFNNGLSKVEINYPLKKWDKNNKILGSVEKLVKYKNNFYLATSKGLMEYDNKLRAFYFVGNLPERCIELAVINDALFIGSESGLRSYNGSVMKEIYLDSKVNTIATSTLYPGILFCGTANGIIMVDLKNKNTITEVESPVKSDIMHIAFLGKDKLLASTRSAGLFYFDIKTLQPKVFPQTRFFSNANENFILNVDERVYLGSDSGLYVINPDLNFVPQKEINDIVRGSCLTNFAFNEKEIFMLRSFVNGESHLLAYSLRDSKKPVQNYLALSKLNNVAVKQYYFDSVNVYVVCDNGVFILDKKNEFYNTKLQSYLSKVFYNKDTVAYNITSNKDSIKFDFNQNKFIFEFGSNDFSDESKLLFQYYLEGYESDFNEWTLKNTAPYNNIKLKEGNYAFHVRAKNVFGQVSDPLLYTFEILPPWYRSKPAYFFYGIIVIGLILLIIRLNAKRLVAQNKRLEKIIDERTQTITLQKTEIEHKNKEITDSINYAQKIQVALMAGLRLLDKNLINKTQTEKVTPKDYFLLYNPKDIVSGDFYWATELQVNKEKYFLIVAADCTGHGVPGAFMSLLCIGFLNEITKEKQIADPGKIFDELRTRIVTTLNPDGSEAERKDGMDAILLGFNANSNIMSYAAANNSFYVIRNNELIILKADKMPVGKYSDEIFKPFTTQTFELQKGDMVYVFTDGYADQFGGPKGKKFKYKQLEEILVQIHKMDAISQRKILSERFDNWKSNYEQVDDVLIIGIQL